MATRIGFVGAGLMGHGIAANLLRAGHALTVLAHRNRGPIDDLVGGGASEASDVAATARAADVLYLCLPSSHEVERVVADAAPALTEGNIIVDVTTADPASTKRLGDELASRDIALVDAPVTRAPADAEAGRLISLVGAGDRAFERVEPLLRCYSEKIIRVGPPGAGHTAKLLNNFVTQTQTAVITQAYLAARAAGVDWGGLYEAMRHGAARSGTLEKMIPSALQGDFRGHAFAVKNALKDITYARTLLASLERPSPLADAVVDHFSHAVGAGLGDRWCSELLAQDDD